MVHRHTRGLNGPHHDLPGAAVKCCPDQLFRYQIRRVELPDEPFAWVTFFTEPADKGREVMIEYNERAAVSRLLIPAIIDSWKSTMPDSHSAWRNVLELLTSGSSSDAFQRKSFWVSYL